MTIRSLSGHFIQLGLQRVVVVYPGDKRYPIADRVEAVPIDALVEPGQLFSAEAGA